ncbi:MAG: hypothetical protein JSV49_01410 [Thermoplasmata archaeon]|nr:MAG: hypothetical protein JSV49_01410 [Thermoplasmata archaeon]
MINYLNKNPVKDLTKRILCFVFLFIIINVSSAGISEEQEEQYEPINISMRSNGELPTVELLLPMNETITNLNNIYFSWKSEDENCEFYYYKIYLDTNPYPTKLIEDNCSDTEYMHSGLDDNTTYYWNVIPVYGEIEGICINGPFTFKTDFTVNAKAEVTIKPDIFEYTMKTDEVLTLKYKITNTGNTVETLTISLNLDKAISETLENDFDKLITSLEPEESIDIEFTVNLKNAYVGAGEYSIILKIESNDRDIYERYDIDINIEKGEIPESQDSDIESPKVKKNDTKEEKSNISIPLVIIATVIILILLIIFVLLIIKMKNRKNI